jgi:hypothetical protein
VAAVPPFEFPSQCRPRSGPRLSAFWQPQSSVKLSLDLGLRRLPSSQAYSLANSLCLTADCAATVPPSTHGSAFPTGCAGSAPVPATVRIITSRWRNTILSRPSKIDTSAACAVNSGDQSKERAHRRGGCTLPAVELAFAAGSLPQFKGAPFGRAPPCYNPVIDL